MEGMSGRERGGGGAVCRTWESRTKPTDLRAGLGGLAGTVGLLAVSAAAMELGMEEELIELRVVSESAAARGGSAKCSAAGVPPAGVPPAVEEMVRRWERLGMGGVGARAKVEMSVLCDTAVSLPPFGVPVDRTTTMTGDSCCL